jgi:hypothetical protein
MPGMVLSVPEPSTFALVGLGCLMVVRQAASFRKKPPKDQPFGVQWLKFQISTDSTTLTLADHGTIFDSSSSNNPWWYYFPSLMVNCADSSTNNYIGAFLHFASWQRSDAGPACADSCWHDQFNRQSLRRQLSIQPMNGVSGQCSNMQPRYKFQAGRSSTAWGTVVARIKPNP